MVLNQSKLDKILTIFFKHQIIIKMYHFQTKSYGAHKASDKYNALFSNNFDKIMETSFGILSKTKVKDIKFHGIMVNDTNIQKYLDEFTKFLTTLDNDFAEHSDLLSIRDDILADTNRFKYLLTFK